MFLFTLVLTLLAPTVFADTAVRIAPEQIFVPTGFDSNDRTEIAASGWLPTPCFGKPVAETKVVGTTIYVTLRTTKRESDVCVSMAYPFLVSAPVGRLAAGRYNIVFNDRSRMPKESKIEISSAKNADSIDDFLYANVEEIVVNEREMTATLVGHHPSDCLALDEIKVVSNQKDTFSVMPIMKQVRQECPKNLVPFEYEFDIPKNLGAKNVLLHVRSLDGTALNRLVRQ